ncbi:unnamed protein product [Gadus morhua 'NCC']
MSPKETFAEQSTIPEDDPDLLFIRALPVNRSQPPLYQSAAGQQIPASSLSERCRSTDPDLLFIRALPSRCRSTDPSLLFIRALPGQQIPTSSLSERCAGQQIPGLLFISALPVNRSDLLFIRALPVNRSQPPLYQSAAGQQIPTSSLSERCRSTDPDLLFIQSAAEEPPTSRKDELLLYQSGVHKALQSENGPLDLFLRFLLGLSLQTNQIVLRGLLAKRETSPLTNEGTVSYIKEKIEGDPSPERSINLFHCLNELNDCSLVEEIQQYLTSGSVPQKSPSPVSTVNSGPSSLLTSEEELEMLT